MIRINELIPVATVNKTHGIHGELSVTVDTDVVLGKGSCLITPVDGIPVPFFVSSIRQRNTDTYLITIDGVDSDVKAAEFTGATFYADPSIIPDDPDSDGEDGEDSQGFYASMIIGSELLDTVGSLVGTVVDIDDSTQNVLMIVKRSDGVEVMIPLAADLLTEFNPGNRSIVMDIPAGLLDMQ